MFRQLIMSWVKFRYHECNKLADGMSVLVSRTNSHQSGYQYKQYKQRITGRVPVPFIVNPLLIWLLLASSDPSPAHTNLNQNNWQRRPDIGIQLVNSACAITNKSRAPLDHQQNLVNQKTNTCNTCHYGMQPFMRHCIE